LPRGSGKITFIQWLDAVLGRVGNLSGDSFLVVGFILGDFVFFYHFAWKGVPEKDLLAVFIGT
jgi:hypothetical protein